MTDVGSKRAQRRTGSLRNRMSTMRMRVHGREQRSLACVPAGYVVDGRWHFPDGRILTFYKKGPPRLVAMLAALHETVLFMASTQRHLEAARG